MPIVNLIGATLLLAAMVAAQVSASLPWVFPGDFRERLRMSGLVVSGTIEETIQAGRHTVDGTKVMANVARLRVDRVFQGNAEGNEVRFTWFTLRWETGGKGLPTPGRRLQTSAPASGTWSSSGGHAPGGKSRCRSTQSRRSWRQCLLAVRFATCRRRQPASDTRRWRRNWRTPRSPSLSRRKG